MNEKRIILNETNLIDFRGRTGKFEFNAGVNKFYGMNGTGKTTLFDAQSWIFFGKNSLGSTKFDIKTLVNGEPVSGSEHSVDSVYSVYNSNHKKYQFERIYKEVWTKTRGALNATKTGNTTTYKIDQKKTSKKNYDALIDQLLQPDGFDQKYLDDEITPTEIYKIVTDPKYFADIHWQLRRKILGQMNGVEIDKQAIIDDIGLRPYLEKYKNDDGEIVEFSIEDKFKISTERQKMINEVLKSFKAKVEEHQLILSKASENPTLISLEDAKKSVSQCHLEIEKYEKKIEEHKTGSNSEINEQLKMLNEKLIEEEKVFSKNRMEARIKFNEIKESIEEKNSQLNGFRRALAVAEKYLNDIRDEYLHVSENDAPEDEKICFNCGRELPESMIIDAREKFNKKMSETLKDIIERGDDTKKTRDNLRKNISEIEIELEKLNKIDPPNIPERKEMTDLVEKINNLQSLKKKNSEIPTELVDGLEKAKLDLTRFQEIEASIKSVEGSRLRIEELQKQKRQLSKEFNEIEKFLYLVSQFNLRIATETENIVNKMFDGNVTFRMFTLQENGALNPTCDIMMDGKPYETALSNGEKVQAGLYIIKTMSKHFKLWAPVFIENAESISVIPVMDCQTIELHHDRFLKTLIQISDASEIENYKNSCYSDASEIEKYKNKNSTQEA